MRIKDLSDLSDSMRKRNSALLDKAKDAPVASQGSAGGLAGQGVDNDSREKTLSSQNASQRKNKYGAVKTEYNGVKYDSKREANRAAQLDLMLRAGEILGWARQVQFVLPGGVKHRVDFIVFHTDGTHHLEDAKGVDTPEGKRSRKLVAGFHQQEIELV